MKLDKITLISIIRFKNCKNILTNYVYEDDNVYCTNCINNHYPFQCYQDNYILKEKVLNNFKNLLKFMYLKELL